MYLSCQPSTSVVSTNNGGGNHRPVATAAPPVSDPAKSQCLRRSAMLRIARSAALLSSKGACGPFARRHSGWRRPAASCRVCRGAVGRAMFRRRQGVVWPWLGGYGRALQVPSRRAFGGVLGLRRRACGAGDLPVLKRLLELVKGFRARPEATPAHPCRLTTQFPDRNIAHLQGPRAWPQRFAAIPQRLVARLPLGCPSAAAPFMRAGSSGSGAARSNMNEQCRIQPRNASASCRLRTGDRQPAPSSRLDNRTGIEATGSNRESHVSGCNCRSTAGIMAASRERGRLRPHLPATPRSVVKLGAPLAPPCQRRAGRQDAGGDARDPG